MHIYAFGSICRGDLSVESDIDLLALVQAREPRLNPDNFSIYSYKRMTELWAEGNAFAWHLALESKIVYTEDGDDFLKSLGMPSTYTSGAIDCERFRDVFEASFVAIENGTPSLVFELSSVFLAVRNLATCYSLAMMPVPTFGRDSARKLGSNSIPMSEDIYLLLMRARLLSTRGVGQDVGEIDVEKVISELSGCRPWIDALYKEVAYSG